MTSPITAAMLYVLVQCAHRPAIDLFADLARRSVASEIKDRRREARALKEVVAEQARSATYMLPGKERGLSYI